MYDTFNYFVESVDLRNHPLNKANAKTKSDYFLTLSYIVNRLIEHIESQPLPVGNTDDLHRSEQLSRFEGILHTSILKEYYTERLNNYRAYFCLNNTEIYDEEKKEKTIATFLRRPWRRKHRIWLVCDLALIVMEPTFLNDSAEIVKQFLSKRATSEIDLLISALASDTPAIPRFAKAEDLIMQYRKNIAFLSGNEHRIIVTANMSAGKSTLINALIGKQIARTSQEVCTGNVCYLYNKAFEDGNVHLATQHLTMSATDEELHSYQWTGAISIASYFASLIPAVQKLCLIDTPGVDAAIYKEHTKRTHDALLGQNYDRVIYVVSPTNLGTDAEHKHLLWVSKNIPHDKIVFVLNKLDDYRSCSDSIEESIQGLREDLIKTGFENPTICPISAYFGLLLKLKLTGQTLSADEEDEYAFFAKKFRRPAYDLSIFYDDCNCLDTDSDEVALYKRSGLYGLENLIYGGRI